MGQCTGRLASAHNFDEGFKRDLYVEKYIKKQDKIDRFKRTNNTDKSLNKLFLENKNREQDGSRI